MKVQYLVQRLDHVLPERDKKIPGCATVGFKGVLIPRGQCLCQGFISLQHFHFKVATDYFKIVVGLLF